MVLRAYKEVMKYWYLYFSYRMYIVATRTFFAFDVSLLSLTPGDYVMTICFLLHAAFLSCISLS